MTTPVADDAAATEAITRHLTRHGVAFTIHRHEAARTGADLTSVSFPRDRWLKTIAFQRQRTGDGWVLAALRYDNAIDYRKLAAAIGVTRRDLALASPATLLDAFGWEVGGVCPLPMVPGVAAVFDTGWSLDATVYCGAGRSDHTLEIRLGDLIAISDGHVCSISKEQ